jgi:hypothetical protein
VDLVAVLGRVVADFNLGAGHALLLVRRVVGVAGLVQVRRT